MLIHEHKTYDNPLGLPIAVRRTRDCEFYTHWHTDFEAAFVLEGSVRVSLNGVPAQLNEGDAFVCSGGDIHSYAEPSADLQVLLLTFDPLAARKTGTLVMDSPVRSSVFYRDVKRTDTQLKALLKPHVRGIRAHERGEASSFYTPIFWKSRASCTAITRAPRLKQTQRRASRTCTPFARAISYIENPFCRGDHPENHSQGRADERERFQPRVQTNHRHRL